MIICPHCGYDFEHEEEPDPNEVGEDNQQDVECPECGKAFLVSWCWSETTYEEYESGDDADGDNNDPEGEEKDVEPACDAGRE